jgi:hypothetical protein
MSIEMTQTEKRNLKKEFEEAAKKNLTSSELAEIYDEFSKDGEDAD